MALTDKNNNSKSLYPHHPGLNTPGYGKNNPGFFIFFILTSFFLLLEISFFLQCNQIYLSGFTEVAAQLKIPISIVPGIIYFICVQLLIHLVYCFWAWFTTLGLARCLPIAQSKLLYLGIFIWVIGVLTCLIANQIYYPNSKFAELTAFFLSNGYIAKAFFWFLLGFIITTSLVGLIGCLLLLSKWGRVSLSLFTIIIIGIGLLIHPRESLLANTASQEKPNIIIIGVDSLRPDFLSFFGGDTVTPFLDNFLQGATIYSDAVTPLARTFPSWVSILTGEHPRKIGIRSNLASQTHVNLDHSLPAILQKQGYYTLFATDESRFSNIDINFGFNRVITPPMGLNDFLIGTINDFPLSNLLINTKLGKWLFPYSYANRGVFFTYNPNSFLEKLQSNLVDRPPKPLFMAVHFCLPHFPYIWSELSANDLNIIERYAATIVRVDQQIADFYAILKKNGLLEQAIVVLLSDHGEALEIEGDRLTEKELFIGYPKINPPIFYPPSLDEEKVNQSAGHGTDVLGLPQYHTLLAFKLFGGGKQNVGLVAGVVSLESIKATLLQMLHIQNEEHEAALSLANSIHDANASIPLRHIFLESDFSPASIRTVYPEMHQVLLEGIQLFEVNPSSQRLFLKPSMERKVIASKQYADIYGDWMLALYPQSKTKRMAILVNLRNGRWTHDLNSTFALNSPAVVMLSALHAFYGRDLQDFG